MKSKLFILLVAGLLAASLVGCGINTESAKSEEFEGLYVATGKDSPVSASPELALDAVYEALEEAQGGYDAWELSEEEFESLTGLNDKEVMEVYAYYSNPKSVLSDVFIVKPFPTTREEARIKLMNYKETRMREFENFNILDAYSIAKEAVICDQGEYLVLLMVSDTDLAQEQVDLYIPQI